MSNDDYSNKEKKLFSRSQPAYEDVPVINLEPSAVLVKPLQTSKAPPQPIPNTITIREGGKGEVKPPPSLSQIVTVVIIAWLLFLTVVVVAGGL